jgi:hypothetical protein
MLHSALFPDLPEAGPVTPWVYLRLRRRAAGLTICDAARRLAPTSADIERVEALLRRLETPGRRALYRSTIESLGTAFALDPSVYWQLVEEAPDRHPRICRDCGCSEHDACTSADGHSTCGWVNAFHCTRCADARREAA